MKLYIFVFFTLATLSLQAYSLVFVHLGNRLPNHLYHTIAQARYFNPEMAIYLVANQSALAKSSSNIPAICIPCESLRRSKSHEEFIQNSTLDRAGSEGFWFYTSERFYYLDELVREKNLSDVFHLENDILLYEDLATFIPAMQKNYPNMIAATFEQEFRCVPGFLYIANSQPLERLVHFMAEQSPLGIADMDLIGSFKKKFYRVWIDLLPTAPPEYLMDERVYHAHYTKICPDTLDLLENNFADFQSIFDAASLGIYVAGDDFRYHWDTAHPGVVNPNCIFSPAYGTIEWELDSESRRIPMFTYNGKKYKINNLHLTNKSVLHTFLSK